MTVSVTDTLMTKKKLAAGKTMLTTWWILVRAAIAATRQTRARSEESLMPMIMLCARAVKKRRQRVSWAVAVAKQTEWWLPWR